jgi:hypothetical protein
MGYNFKKFLIIFFFLIFLPFLIEAIEFKPPWQTKSFQELLDAIYNFIFWVAIALVPIMVIVAAYFFLTSGGDPEKVRTAKRIIFWVFIGLIIVLMGKGILPIIRQLIEGGPVAGPPPSSEVCNNNLDDDGDGLIDCDDPDCNSDPACPCPPQVCQNLLNLTQSLFGKTCSSSDYNPVADIDKDKSIGMRDIGLVTTMCNNALACQNAWNNTCNPCIGPCP